MEQVDITIIGGGLNGLTLAVALGQQGKSVALIDRLPRAQSPNGRTTAIASGIKNVFENLGVWDHMSGSAEPILKVKVTDGNFPLFLQFDQEEAPLGYVLENHVMREALLKNLSANYFHSAEVENIEDDESVIVTTNNKTISSKLLVGADGRHSFVRKWARIPCRKKSYGQSAIVAVIGHSTPHHGLAHERFLKTGPFGLVPAHASIGDSKYDYRSQMIWCLPPEEAAYFADLPDEKFLQKMGVRFGEELGQMDLATKRQVIPLTFNHARDYIAKRTVLIGDAAHGLHPVAGQGLNLGMRDVACLVEELAEAPDPGSAAVLKSYQRRRRPDVMTFVAMSDGLTQLFSSNKKVVSIPRKIGFGLVGHVPILKKIFVKEVTTSRNAPKLFQQISL